MFDLTALKRIVAAAASAGLLAGAALTAFQQIAVVPLLLEAERYEHAGQTSLARAHAESITSAHAAEAGHSGGGSVSRLLLSAASNVVLAVGLALLLGAAMFVGRTPGDWRSGLLWGLAGYAVVFVAPSLGLPPELPGSETAGLGARQLWWVGAVLATGAGLALTAARSWASKVFGIAFIVAPHAVGAPRVASTAGVVPADLAASFLAATALTNLAFWLVLGGLLGRLLRKSA